MPIIHVISIKDVISSRLEVRKEANYFFENGLSKVIVDNLHIDFSQVDSISHSFAYQYLVCKYNCDKKIREINVPRNISNVIKSVQKRIDKDNQ